MTKTSRSSGRLIEANQEEGEDSSMAGESSPEAPRFKKMKPRVGHQYQTRVPKSVPSAPYAPNRPAPDKLSAEYPDARLKDIDMKDGDIVSEEQDNGMLPSTGTGDFATVTSIPVQHDSRNFSRRGGTCVHRAASSIKDHDAVSFIHTAQHLLLPLPPQTPVLSSEAFAQEMISRYGSTTNTRRKKRRLASADEEWTSCEALTAKYHKDLGAAEGYLLEDQEAMLEHLQARHGGNVEQAELGLKVHLSHGTARKARRILLKDWHSNRFKRPSVQSSASWRQRMEFNSSIWGDLRNEPTEVMFPFNGAISSIIGTTASASMSHADDDMKGVWRSILAYAQSMERALATAEEGGQKPKFSEVVNFIRSAYALPLPEESFGNRHVCVEQLSECFQTLLDHVSKGRDALAEISDFLAKDDDGVDMDALRKLLDDQLPKDCSLALDEDSVLRALLVAASEWQQRVDVLSDSSADESEQDYLIAGKELAEEARSFVVRTGGLVLLEKRIEKALQLEDRLEEFNRGGTSNTIKLASALVRDANRVSLPSLQVRNLLKLNKELELWVDRANIAIRSRISLSEIEWLVDRAQAMPLSLNEFVDKLNSRVRLARNWIAQLEEEVPGISMSGDDYEASGLDKIEWMKRIRFALADDKSKGSTCSRLLDLSSEGVRIPVEITSMKMLQIEIDAKNWSQKAEKWIPQSTESKKGKVEDLRDHLRKAEMLRDRLPVDEKEAWSLEHEVELRDIVDNADKWFEEFEPYLDWDNRRFAARSCLSLEKLRRIVTEGLSIHAQIGNSVTKMARVLSQAETWFEKNESLLVRAGILKVGGNVCVGLATLTELTNAATAASSDISLDLEEAVALKEVVAKIQSWVDRTGNAAPIKRSKRVGKGRWSRKPTRFRIDDLVELINEAKMLPIPTADEVQRLEAQLNDVHIWRIKAHDDLKAIASGFDGLRTTIESVHGSPDYFYNDESIRRLINVDRPEIVSDESIVADPMEIDAVAETESTSDMQEDMQVKQESNALTDVQDEVSPLHTKEEVNAGAASRESNPLLPEEEAQATARSQESDLPQPDGQSQAAVSMEVETKVTCSDELSQADAVIPQEKTDPKLEGGSTSTAEASSQSSEGDLDMDTAYQNDVDQNDVEKSISAMLTEARQIGIVTGEEDVVLSLDSISKWCSKSLKALETPSDLYEKRNYSNFDALIKAGRDLLVSANSVEDKSFDEELAKELCTSWSTVVKEQLQRLDKLRAHRDKFVDWSKLAHALMSARDKKITFESVDGLAEQSREYPSSADVVQRVRTLHHRMSKWKEEATAQMYAPERKMIMQEAKELCDEGDKLKLSCHELKILRNAIRTARGWMNRVKKCKVAEGGTTASEVERLIDEHDDLIIAMPAEVEKLKQVMKGYCLCRRPYEGFMIGCDGCDEWYHCSCIGVSESQADRYEKYVCVRCCVKRVYKNSATAVASTIRKWTNEKDRKKSRQSDYQKHQRKVRKEKKDIEKCEANIVELRQQLEAQMGIEDEVGKSVQALEIPNEGTPASMILEEPGQNVLLQDSAPPVQEPASDKNQSEEPPAVVMVPTEKDVPSSEVTSDAGETIAPSTEEYLPKKEGETANVDAEKEKALPKISREEAEKQINDLLQSISDCKDRLHALSLKSIERSNLDKDEDSFSKQLKVWCLRVRSRVLVPSKIEIAENSRPLADGSLSSSMLELFQDAELLGIAQYADVHVVANAFQCISWSSLAMSTLAKRPTLAEIQHVLNCCSSLTLPDEKALRILKSMVQRTSQWQIKARKALAPKPGETRPYSMELLRSLEFGCSAVPFEVPEGSCLANAIEDKGRRYCLCGGANDGSFMLGCDKCENWFHGRCVGIDKDTGNNLESWHCPMCNGEEAPTSNFEKTAFDFADIEDDEGSLEREDSPNAPTMEKLWPPFGLLGSASSQEALGESCLLIADSVGDLDKLMVGALGSAPQTDNPASASGGIDQPQHIGVPVQDESSSIQLVPSQVTEKEGTLGHSSQVSIENDDAGSTTSKGSVTAIPASLSNNDTELSETCEKEDHPATKPDSVATAAVREAAEALVSIPVTHAVSPDLEENDEDKITAPVTVPHRPVDNIEQMDCEDGANQDDAMDCDDVAQPRDTMDCDKGSLENVEVGCENVSYQQANEFDGGGGSQHRQTGEGNSDQSSQHHETNVFDYDNGPQLGEDSQNEQTDQMIAAVGSQLLTSFEADVEPQDADSQKSTSIEADAAMEVQDADSQTNASIETETPTEPQDADSRNNISIEVDTSPELQDADFKHNPSIEADAPMEPQDADSQNKTHASTEQQDPDSRNKPSIEADAPTKPEDSDCQHVVSIDVTTQMEPQDTDSQHNIGIEAATPAEPDTDSPNTSIEASTPKEPHDSDFRHNISVEAFAPTDSQDDTMKEDQPTTIAENPISQVWEQPPEEAGSDNIAVTVSSSKSIDPTLGSSAHTRTNVDSWDGNDSNNANEEASAGNEASLGAELITSAS